MTEAAQPQPRSANSRSEGGIGAADGTVDLVVRVVVHQAHPDHAVLRCRVGEFIADPPVEGEDRRTPLYEVHAEAGAKMVPFAGWEMPVAYTSIGEEHGAVRSTAGFFDVGHMGVFEASGPAAARFLDLATSNYVRKLRIGESQYAYLLDPDGGVVDDLMIYHVAPDTYMIVVNAVNADKD